MQGMRSTPLVLRLSVVASLAFAACTPVLSTPIAEIPKLTSLKEVMHNQATVADPQWGKIGADAYTDADYAAFAELAERIGATSLKIKDFTQGADFDALAVRLHEKADALGVAVKAKDLAATSGSLKDMKATCKECHSKFR